MTRPYVVVGENLAVIYGNFFVYSIGVYIKKVPPWDAVLMGSVVDSVANLRPNRALSPLCLVNSTASLWAVPVRVRSRICQLAC